MLIIVLKTCFETSTHFDHKELLINSGFKFIDALDTRDCFMSKLLIKICNSVKTNVMFLY